MKEYYTCDDCLQEGKEIIKPDLRAIDAPISSVECAYCSKNLSQDSRTKEAEEHLNKLLNRQTLT